MRRLEPAASGQLAQLSGRRAGYHAGLPARDRTVELADRLEHERAAPSGHLAVDELQPDEPRGPVRLVGHQPLRASLARDVALEVLGHRGFGEPPAFAFLIGALVP